MNCTFKKARILKTFMSLLLVVCLTLGSLNADFIAKAADNENVSQTEEHELIKPEVPPAEEEMRELELREKEEKPMDLEEIQQDEEITIEDNAESVETMQVPATSTGTVTVSFPGTQDQSFSDLASAAKYANTLSGSSETNRIKMVVDGEVASNSTAIFEADKFIKLTGSSESSMVKRVYGFRNDMLTVAENSNLEVSNIILDGNRSEELTSRGSIINNKGNLILNNKAIIQNNYGSEKSGGICNSGNFIMKNSTIQNNEDRLWDLKKTGGGIHNSGTFTMESGVIKNNKSTYGGGISNLGTFSMKGGSIENNNAGLGGGIHNSKNLIIQGGTINKNYGGQGGGIRNYIDANAAIQNVNIKENSGRKGGGVYNLGTATMKDSTISKNTVSMDGSAIENLRDGTFTIENVIIKENFAKQAGTVGNGNNGKLIMESGIIENNSADVAAGICNGFNGLFIINDGAIRNNTARYGTGIDISSGIGANKSTVIMNGGEISDNSATYTGAGVHVFDKCTFIMRGGKIKNNKSDKFGGGIYAEGNSKVIIEEGIIEDNSAKWIGGGIYNLGDFTLEGGIIRNNSTSSHNGGGVYSSASYNLNGSFTMNGGSIEHNSSGGRGGGVFVNSPKYNFTMNGGVIKDNSSKGFGGGIYGGDVKINGGIIENNTSRSSGKGIYASKLKLSNDAQFKNNDIYLPNEVTVEIEDNLNKSGFIITPDKYREGRQVLTGTPELVKNNYQKFSVTPQRYGPNWCIDSEGRLQINKVPIQVVFKGDIKDFNTLHEAFAYASSISGSTENDVIQVNVLQDVPLNSTADLKGNKPYFIKLTGTGKTIKRAIGFTGEMITTANNTNLEVANVVLDGNKEEVKSAMPIISNKGKLTLSDGAVLQNNISPFGSGVFNAGTFTMNGGSICNNVSESYGGGVFCASNATFNMNSGQIHNNSAESGGGVLILGTLSIQNGSIYNNSAQNGGGVFIASTATGTMVGGKIHHNTAEKGGGVYNSKPFTMEGGSIYENSAKQGSGIFNEDKLKLSKGAEIVKNDTYILNGKSIEIIGSLEKSDFTITPEVYQEGKVVLTGTKELIKQNYTKFLVTEQEDGTKWTVDEEGKLKKLAI